MYTTDTIAAIATPLSPAGISIIRISGDDAFDVAKKIFKSGKTGKECPDLESHRVYYGRIEDGEKIIDEVMLIAMKAPKSFTMEDTIEIDCHGGVVVTKEVLECIIKNGARPAEPGEFTKRAFLNGRIDLSQAEGISELITAKNDLAASNAIGQIRGSVYERIEKLRSRILEQTAFIEAALDDPEHYSLDGYTEKLKASCSSEIEEISGILQMSKNGRKLTEGINTVILGKPNAGKSSLLNLITGKEKAIVTDIAGTTRDSIEAEVVINGITLNIMDTAGIRESDDPVEKMGIDRAFKALNDADLILYVADSSVEIDDNDKKIIEKIDGLPAIVLLNKSDIMGNVDKDELCQLTGRSVFEISAKENIGLDAVEKEIEKMFFGGRINLNDEVIITTIRQINELELARESLILAKNGIDAGYEEDLISIDLMNAYDCLGRIIGQETDEDLIDTIFEKFCMGK